jgi:hypothetical protein
MSIARLLLAGAFVLAGGYLVQAQDQQEQGQQEEKPAEERKKAEPVDFRKLRDALPEQISILKRTERQGERMSMGEYNVTIARGQYTQKDTGDEAPSASIDVQDYGAMPEVLEGLAYWTQVEIDREGDDGYQRTIKLNGHPAMEQYRTQGRDGEVQVLVAGRFFMSFSAHNVSQEQFEQIVKALPTEEFAKLK